MLTQCAENIFKRAQPPSHRRRRFTDEFILFPPNKRVKEIWSHLCAVLAKHQSNKTRCFMFISCSTRPAYNSIIVCRKHPDTP